MSVLSGFEYDIFISYRHNDNLDGWVTDFVQNLEKELRSTLKDSLTIYFDKNPHDGLLETHNVDKSLEGKLKCLIFIPIISQTYCDTKSFAWQYEFVAFNRLASGHFPSPAGEGGLRPDEGRDIKLSNGNVASRILPIKIHDLDAEDKSLLESELGGVLRAIEFIYKESGVNRPLKSTDSKTDNQNKTDYRNQVNKVANAIKEIIAALKNPVVKTSGTIISKPIKIKANQSRNVIVSSVAVVLLMAIGTYWLYPKLFVSNKVDVLDKSIAVIPFVNIGKDPEQEYLSDGLSDELITTLGRISSLKVPGRTSSFEFKNKNIDLREIGRKLNVAYLLEGTVQKSGNKIRVNIKLIKASDGLQIWSYTYNTDLRDILQIQDLIASAIVEKLSIKLLQENTSQLDLVNREAYDLYLRGRYYWNRRGRGLEESLKYFKKAIELDPNFDLAYSGLADSYLMMSFLDYMPANEGIPWCKEAASKALQLNPFSSEAAATLGFVYLIYEWDFEKSGNYFRISKKVNPNNAQALYWYSMYKIQINADLDSGVFFAKSSIEAEPLSLIPYTHRCYASIYKNNYEEAIKYGKSAFALDSTNFLSRHSLGMAFTLAGQYNDAIKVFRMSPDLRKLHSWILINLSYAYVKAGQKDKARELLQEAKRREKEGSILLSNLGMIAANLGDYDTAFSYMKKALQQKEGMFVLSKNWVLLDNHFRHDPRYVELTSFLNLPDLWSGGK